MIDLGKLLQEAFRYIAAKRDRSPNARTANSAGIELPGGMKVGITASGSPSRFNLRTAINEYKFYIENNSKLKLDINFVQETNLSPEEIPRYNTQEEILISSSFCMTDLYVDKFLLSE